MAFKPAGVIDGATTHAETLRRQLYYAANGSTGVSAAGALAVTALGTPGPSVNIAPGAGVIVSTYAGAAAQAYSVANDATVAVAVPANGTGATVVQHVLISIRDPQYPGMPTPPVPATDLYFDIEVRPTFPGDRPYLWLADITMAAGASTVTNGMITQKAVIGSPRQLVDGAPYFPAATRNMPATTYGDWPLLGITVPVPSWATYGIAEFMVNGAAYTGGDTGVGGVRVALAGTADTQNGIITSSGVSRQSLFVMGRWTIPVGVRGTNAALVLQGAKTAGAGQFTVDYQSQIIAKWTFQETV